MPVPLPPEFAAYSTDGHIQLSSGLYVPSLTNTTNVSSSSIPYDGNFQWIKVGSVVTVSGILNVTPTTSGLNTQLDIDLPVGTSIAAYGEEGRLAGLGVMLLTLTSLAVKIYGVSNKARLEFLASDTSANDVAVSFTYRVV